MRPDKKKKNYSKGNPHGRDQEKPERPKVPPQPPRFSGESVVGPEDGVLVTTKDPPKSGKVVAEKPPKNISTNWTKFEIPSDDENFDDSNMSGMDFTLALENAAGSSAQLVLKSEAGWDQMTNDLNSESFCVNIKVIQDALECIPLHKRIGLSLEESDASTLNRLTELAEANLEKFLSNEKKDVTSLSEKILLSLKPDNNEAKEPDRDFESDIDELLGTVSLDNLVSVEILPKPDAIPSGTNETKELEDWLDDFLE